MPPFLLIQYVELPPARMYVILPLGDHLEQSSRDSSELVCYGIDMNHERFVKFSAYAKYVDEKLICAPKNSCVDMQNAKVASVWTVTLERNKKGEIELTKAKFVENIDDDEGL